MRNALLAAFMGSTALWSATAALAQMQPQITPEVVPRGEVRGRAAITECNRLIEYLEQRRPVDLGITVEQAREWRNAANAAACREHIERLRVATEQPTQVPEGQTPRTGSPVGAAPVTPPQAAAEVRPPPAEPIGSAPPAFIDIQGPPPAEPSQAETAAPLSDRASTATQPRAPQVRVQQVQPNVTVHQPRPEIIVRQAPPIITVQQPQPEIIVRMPDPDVNVSVVQPEVQLVMPRPQVQVVPPEEDAGQANVEIETQQPIVRYERTGPPQIVYQEAEGQPQIRFESLAGQNGAPAPAATARNNPAAQPQQTMQPQRAPLSPEAAQAQLNPGFASSPVQSAPARTDQAVPRQPPRSEPQQTGALPPMQRLTVDQIEDMAVYNTRNEKIGDVERVVIGADNRSYAVIGQGGFLGLGERRVAVPLDQMALRGDRLVTATLEDEQIRSLPDYDQGAYRPLEGGQTAPLRVLP